MNKRKCLILAAGIGSRLHPLTSATPKCCLEIKRGQKLVRRLVEQLIKYTTAEEIIISVGFESAQIIDALSDISFSISYSFNSKFNETNNMYSAWLALRDTSEDIEWIVINADCIYEDSIIEKIESCKGSAILYDPIKWDEESMKIRLGPDYWIQDIGKDVPRAESTYVSVDLYKVGAKDFDNYFQTIASYVGTDELNYWNEVAFRDLMNQGKVQFSAVSIGDAKWYEIDTVDDLKSARNVFNN